ncbi:MAG TPA: fibronectin type III domain-containing protein, partial [Mycobacterium sp.]|nr:fibronectin type III domain-containing protein [Mycobacterium sp.]
MQVERSALATPTFVQKASATPTGSPSTVTVTYAAAQTAGNLNVVIVGWNNTTSTVATVTDSKSNIYQLAVGPTRSGSTESISMYYARSIASAAANGNTVSVHFSGGVPTPDIRILEYSGIDKQNPLDAVAVGSGNSTVSSTASLTTTRATDLLVAGNNIDTGTTGAGTGFTSRVITTPNGDIAEDRVVTSVGNYSASAPLSATGQWVMQLVAFRALDNTVPSAPTNLTASVISSSEIDLSWTASTDDIGVTGYSVERCLGSSCTTFAVVGSPTGTTFANTGLLANSTYRFRVRATDAAGNFGAYSSIATGSTPNTCATNSQCGTGFCANGVCCNVACNGGCGACNLTGHIGTCTALTGGTSCRAANGGCDVAETCDGASLSCPTDGFAPSTTVCRAASGVCDVAEHCTGTNAACPSDAFAPSTTVCRGAS